MIEWKTGNLFDSKCNIWVNTVNCEGVMGKGIALEFKKKFPKMFKWYVELCNTAGQFNRGGFWRIYVNSNGIFSDQISPSHIICVATKEKWRNKSKVEWIEQFLKEFSEYGWSSLVSFAFPKLGCGNGGLDWITQVKPLMIKYLEPLPNKIEIYV